MFLHLARGAARRVVRDRAAVIVNALTERNRQALTSLPLATTTSFELKQLDRAPSVVACMHVRPACVSLAGAIMIISLLTVQLDFVYVVATGHLGELELK